MPASNNTTDDDDGLAWRHAPHVSTNLERIATLGLDDLVADVTSPPLNDALATKAAAVDEDDDDDDEEDTENVSGFKHASTGTASFENEPEPLDTETENAEANSTNSKTNSADDATANSQSHSETADDAASESGYSEHSRADDSAEFNSESEHVRKTKTRLMVIRIRDEMFKNDPQFKKKTINELNSEAVTFLKNDDDLHAVGAFAKLFRKLLDNHLVHKDLHVVHSNRSLAYLNLGLHEEALWDARRCQQLAEERYHKTHDVTEVAPIFRKAYARKGFALMGLGRYRLAKSDFEHGLRMGPDDPECKRGLEEAIHAIARDILSGRNLETPALPSSAAPVTGQISNLPHAAPMHHVHPTDQLPIRLLTPFQADNEYHIKDTYNYMTVQADIRVPRRHFKYLEDEQRLSAFSVAVERAVNTLTSEAKDVRVLHLGCGAGYLTMQALRNGAHHVIATDRWLYHAMACKESLLANGYGDDQVKVVYKRPTDIAMLRDVPISCNLLINEMFDDGLLSCGLLPGFKHASSQLLLPDATLIPASATVYVMPVEMRVDSVCGLDVSAMNLYRHAPSHTSAIKFDKDAFTALASPKEAFYFDFQNPPDVSETKQIDFEFHKDGKWNAVVFWYELKLCEGVVLSTAPEQVRGVLGESRYRASATSYNSSTSSTDVHYHPSSLNAAAQYLLGEISVTANDVMPLQCAHNTVAVQFSVTGAEFNHVHKKVASFPQYHFDLLRDTDRARAYDDAIKRRVKKLVKKKAKLEGVGEKQKKVSVLDIGAGSGLLAMMAARAGADKVVASEWHADLATCARRNIAQNKLSNKVTVAVGDVAKLQRGKQGVPIDGFDVAVVDLFDAGFTGDHALWMLEQARKNVMHNDCHVIPAAATMYVMGVEAYTAEVDGFDFSAFNKYRWDSSYRATRLSDEKHRPLTKPKRVFEFFLDQKKQVQLNNSNATSRESVVRLETINAGYMNAVVFWFDLHMDEKETITTAPVGYGKGGVVLQEELLRDDPIALKEAREVADQAAADQMSAAAMRHAETLAANPRTYLGGEREVLKKELEKEAKDAFDIGANSHEKENTLQTDATDTTDTNPLDTFKAVVPVCRDSSDNVGGENKDSRTQHPPKQENQKEHYWGQAVQYLERGVQVQGSKKITLLARRESDRVSFTLKEGVGAFVGKPPWKIEWGGGASVESPHFQRVHYCELLVGDFLMRLRSKRFPPIEKEMRMILAHCGNLFLDPAVVEEITHWFACLELVHGQQDFSPGASMEALTKRPLRLG